MRREREHRPHLSPARRDALRAMLQDGLDHGIIGERLGIHIDTVQIHAKHLAGIRVMSDIGKPGHYEPEPLCYCAGCFAPRAYGSAFCTAHSAPAMRRRFYPGVDERRIVGGR